MSIHDWTRADARIFDALQRAWLRTLWHALNDGLLPKGYYVLSELHAGMAIPDILTMHTAVPEKSPCPPLGGGVATVTKTRPRVQRRLVARASPKGRRRSLAVRHETGHRLVALIEIMSPANKDTKRSVTEFVNKAVAAIQLGIHVSLLELMPPGPCDPGGMHGAIWERFDTDRSYDLPANQPLTLAAYAAANPPKAYIDHRAVGEELPEMPLFLTGDGFVRLPLETTYAEAYREMPEDWREVIEGKREPE